MYDCEAYFNKVYSATYREMLRYAVIKTSSAEDARDVVQDVYGRFYSRIAHRGYNDLESARAYLFRIMKRELATHYANRKRKSSLEEPFKAEHDLSAYEFEPDACERCDTAMIWELITTLPEQSYKAFTLYYGFDMSIKAISDELGLSEENVKTRLYRARAAVRKAMKGDHYYD